MVTRAGSKRVVIERTGLLARVPDSTVNARIVSPLRVTRLISSPGCAPTEDADDVLRRPLQYPYDDGGRDESREF